MGDTFVGSSKKGEWCKSIIPLKLSFKKDRIIWFSLINIRVAGAAPRAETWNTFIVSIAKIPAIQRRETLETLEDRVINCN